MSGHEQRVPFSSNSGSSACRILLTARKMLCLVALVLSPRAAPTSSIDMPSTWRSVKAARSRPVRCPSASPTRRRNLAALCQPQRGRLAVGAALAERALLEIRRVVGVLAMPPRADEVDGAVDRDPVQPGADVRPGLETAELPVRLEPGLLHHVLRVRRVAGHPMGDANR